jgi:hypothetical protein
MDFLDGDAFDLRGEEVDGDGEGIEQVAPLQEGLYFVGVDLLAAWNRRYLLRLLRGPSK